MESGGKDKIRRLRVSFEYADDQFLYVRDSMSHDGKLIKVRYNIPQVNDEFSDGVPSFWQGAQLNLLNVSCEEDGILTPSFIVLEPDYLLDVSTLAECYRDYGCHPGNFLMNRLLMVGNSRPLLLGNIANLFLDEWIYARDQEPDFERTMKKAFKQYPVELAVCEELRTPEQSRAFAGDCRMHFENLKQIVSNTFGDAVYRLDKSDAVLEPSYICEALGIQGRLDYMQRNMSGFIEMKSGRADEFSVKGKIVPKVNHRVQMLLYMAMLEFCMDFEHQKQRPYLLYTRYPVLYPARSSWAQVRRIIHLRNMIVVAEYATQLHNRIEYTAGVFNQINPQTLNQKKLRGRLWNEFLRPQIQDFRNKLDALEGMEKAYFYTLYNFITKELYLSKAGGMSTENKRSMSSLWLESLEAKRESGDILYDLKIVDNQTSRLHKAYVKFSIPDYGEDFLPNFRVGDVVVFYERNRPEDMVTNKLVLKGNVEAITDSEICIRLRAAQRNQSVFSTESLYAVEHDSMDTTFNNMYNGLWTFLNANIERKALLLGCREPRFDSSFDEKICHSIDDFDRIALKAAAAQDYFLLIGPPGTGKTSRALSRMVEMFLTDTDSQILLMAYTNRAVDEICQSLSNSMPSLDYIRVGSELSCDVCYREHLLENVLASCKTRTEVLQRMSSCRIYVGTVATVSSKPELFKLKCFNVAIVDEATQILEPQLLSVLCAKTSEGKDAVGKFVLIGDHKQLPAVVLQDKKQSEVHDEDLHRMGMLNLKDSLFERLYRLQLKKNNPRAFDMLRMQGRMHPLVAEFPNKVFYAGKLKEVGLPHQKMSMKSAVSFQPSLPDTSTKSGKTNRMEAQIAAGWAVDIWNEYGADFDAGRTLGIIAPYRNQIALIRRELRKAGIPELEQVSVDTVERYQGSERDVIIYSFCLNRTSQLELLPNLTEENGVLIDRKLNVALTRARKRLYITGAPEMMRRNDIYRKLLDYLTCNKTSN